MATNAQTLKEIEDFAKKMQRSVKEFETKDRRAILKAAARPIVSAARAISRPKDSKRPHYRYSKGTKIKYNPGNLRRSIKSMVFRRSPDVFVGPKWGKKDEATEYGGVGQPVDGYYYAMAYGSGSIFKNRVLDGAVSQAGQKAVQKIKLKAIKRFKGRLKIQGLQTD